MIFTQKKNTRIRNDYKCYLDIYTIYMYTLHINYYYNYYYTQKKWEKQNVINNFFTILKNGGLFVSISI